MKKPDLFSRRILSVSIGITMVILSISLLILSLNNVTTANADNVDFEWLHENEFKDMQYAIPSDTIVSEVDSGDAIIAIQAFGIGIREGNLYFGILYSNNSIGLHKAPADGEDVLDW
jgi:hypothetical protein